MKEQLHPNTLLAKPFSAKHIGTPPLAIALASCDIGTAELEDGTKVYITWGRNLGGISQEHYLSKTSFQPIWVGADDGSAELVLPTEKIEPLLPFLLKS